MDLEAEEEDEIFFNQIESMTIPELYSLGKKLSISNCETIHELKQKIILNRMIKNESNINASHITNEFKTQTEMVYKEDKLRRELLMKYFIKVEVVFEEIKNLKKLKTTNPGKYDVIEVDDPLLTKIKNEYNDNIDNKFKLVQKSLIRKENCVIMICGDSGAGKSSFINLLINEEILPTSLQCNTACQVRLSYDRYERAEIIDLNDHLVTIEKKDFPIKLRNYLEELGNRNSFSSKRATIYLNSPILENGLDIIDTIGFGEKKIFNDDFTKNLHVSSGFILILRKNDPIGDNSVGGLTMMINHMVENGFFCSSMYFIINMCDLLNGTEEKFNLKKNIINQIINKCSFSNPKITTFCTKNELFLQKHKYMSKDFKDIMNHIQQLIIYTTNNDTAKIFIFLFKFVQKSIDYIIESEKITIDDKVYKADYINRLRNLEEDRKLLNKYFIKQNNLFIKEKYYTYQGKITKYFKNKDTKTKVINDVLQRKRQLFDTINSEEIKKKIIQMTRDSILRELEFFLKQENILQNCCNEMLKIFIQQYAEHEKKKDQINEAMNRHIESALKYIKGDMTSIDDLMELSKEISRIFAPLLICNIKLENFFSKFLNNQFCFIGCQSPVEKLCSNDVSYLSRESKSYYKDFFNKNENIKIVMNGLFAVPHQVTKDFQKYLDDDMKYLAKNIDYLDSDVRNRDNIETTYKHIKRKLEKIYNELCKFNLLYLKKDKKDIMQDKVKIIPSSEDNTDDPENPIIINRSRAVYKGHFTDNQFTDSCILKFRNLDGKSWKDIYHEFSKHKNILIISEKSNNSEASKYFIDLRFHVLYKINGSQDVWPMFIVNGIDHSLKTYIDEFRNTESRQSPENLYQEILRLIHQILNGLKYLHAQQPSLVHYDLTVDSIGYNSMYRKIKLSTISFETKVKIDYKKESRSYVLNMSHFPVEILDKNSNELYSSKSDIYGLGVIIYYLWIGINPFFQIITDENINNIENFVLILKRSILSFYMHESLFSAKFEKEIFNWSLLCLIDRPSAHSFFEDLTQLISKPDLI